MRGRPVVLSSRCSLESLGREKLTIILPAISSSHLTLMEQGLGLSIFLKLLMVVCNHGKRPVTENLHRHTIPMPYLKFGC